MDKKGIKNKALSYLEQFRHLKSYLILAGIKLRPVQAFIILYVVTAIVDLSFLFYFVYLIVQYEVEFIFIIIVSFVMVTLGYVLIFMIVWLIFLVMIDYLKFKRKTALEEVLPEFLRLVAANHRSGLPLDLSLWKANRPRFGILSDEINQIARSTYASGSLIEPLNEFSKKYDSSLLRRIVSNLIEGIKTGADIASLLDDISMNIIMIRYTKKELASEVENYMLFITMTVLIISPFMFGLTYKMTGLIETVKNTLVGTFDASDDAVSKIPGGSIVPVGESTEDFRYYFDWFVHLMLATNVIVSVLLMSMVKHGNVKQDLKKIPVFYVICISVYALSKLLFSNFLVI